MLLGQVRGAVRQRTDPLDLSSINAVSAAVDCHSEAGGRTGLPRDSSKHTHMRSASPAAATTIIDYRRDSSGGMSGPSEIARLRPQFSGSHQATNQATYSHLPREQAGSPAKPQEVKRSYLA